MNVAIIGAGNIAQTHAKALSSLGQRLCLVVNHNPEKAQAFAQKWKGAHASAHFHDALNPEIDVVHICTPPALHVDMIHALLNAGKHIVCEKPLCLHAHEAKQLHRLAKESNVLTAVNFNVRYHEAIHRAKQRISALSFGDIRMISGWYKQEFHLLPTAHSWRYQPDLAGPMRAVTEIGSHWFDLARYLTGLEITQVSALFGNFHPKRVSHEGMLYPQGHAPGSSVRINSEDAALITLRFSNNALGHVLLSEVSHGRSNNLLMEVTGEDESLWWNSEDPYALWDGHKNMGTNRQVNAFGGGFPDTFECFFRDVYKALEQGERKGSFPSFSDGAINACVCDAIYNSAQSAGVFVEVPSC